MRSRSRLAAVVMNLLVVQLVLAGAGTRASVAPVGEGHAGHAAAMQGAAGPAHGGSHEPGCPDCEAPAQRSPCDEAMSPGACSTMPACAVALAPGAPAEPLVASAHAGVAAVSDSAPAGPVAAPELPPPRA